MATKKVLLGVRVKHSTYDELRKIAESKDEPLSEYVRKLLENHLLTR